MRKMIHDTGAIMPGCHLGSLCVAIPPETARFMEINGRTVLQGITTVIDGFSCYLVIRHE